MHSYDSPGRVVTIVNGGPGAVPVVGDQPYRLRSHHGVTQGPAGIGEELNLSTEGVHRLTVDLADGVDAARAGDLVHLALDGSWSLVAGLDPDDAEGFLPFAVLNASISDRDMVLMKLLPPVVASAAQDVGGGSGDGAARWQVGDITDMTPAHDKTGWLPLQGQVLDRTSWLALAAFFGDYAPQAVSWATGSGQVSANLLSGGGSFFKGLFVFGSISNTGVQTTVNGSALSARTAPASNKAFATDGTTLMGFSGSTSATKSADGIAWSAQALTWAGGALTGNPAINGAIFAAGKWVVVGNSSLAGDYDLIGTSTDGAAFTRRQSSLEMQLWAIAYGNGLFCAVGDNGGVVTSPDGDTWTVRNSRCSQTLRSIIHDGTRFVAVGVGGRIVTSFDGIFWNPAIIDAAMSDVYSIAFGGGVYVAVGSSSAIEGRSRIKVSSDLSSWTDRILDANPARPSYTPYRVVFGAGRFVMTFAAAPAGSFYDYVASSAAPDINVATQFVLPTATSSSPELSKWIRAA